MAVRYKKLDLNLLFALEILLTECSVVGAAERLNLSQSATSSILGRLREYFDDELLVQVGRKMVPSPLGIELVSKIRHVLHTVDATIMERTHFDHRSSDRHFKFCASDFVKTVLLTDVAQELSRAAPNITIEISNPDCDLAGQLERREFDFFILPEYLLDETHPKMTLFESRHTCVVWQGNKLVGQSLTFEQFLSLDHVVIRFGKSHRPSFEEWFIDRYGHTRKVAVVTDDFNSVPQFIFGTQRVATVHEHLARFYQQHLDLRLIPPPIEIPALNEGIQWHKSLDHDQGHIWMRQLIRRMANRGLSDAVPLYEAAAVASM